LDDGIGDTFVAGSARSGVQTEGRIKQRGAWSLDSALPAAKNELRGVKDLRGGMRGEYEDPRACD